MDRAAMSNKNKYTCAQICRGRSIPCLLCDRPEAAPWPAEHDTFSLLEWLTGPVLLAVPVGLVIGFAYGVLRHFGIAN